MKNIEHLLKNKYINYGKINYPVLKDMFERGIAHNGISNEHDEFLDVTASLLIKIHKDKTILPILVDMIFFRNREGLFTHDLIWAFFQARDPYSLMLIANYLDSDDSRDVKLAYNLLNFVPSINMSMRKNSINPHITFFYWLRENSPFLYFTGEGYQSTSKPIPYRVSLDGKYLCRRVSLNTGKTLLPLTKRENKILGCFNNLDEENKELLSRFSLRIHSENMPLWTSWLKHSISKQISIAEGASK